MVKGNVTIDLKKKLIHVLIASTAFKQSAGGNRY